MFLIWCYGIFNVNCACIIVIFFWIWPLGKIHVFMRWFCGVFLWIFICICFCFDDVLVFSFVHCSTWPVGQAHAIENLWFWSLGQFHVFLYLVLICWIIECFCFFVVFKSSPLTKHQRTKYTLKNKTSKPNPNSTIKTPKKKHMYKYKKKYKS